MRNPESSNTGRKINTAECENLWLGGHGGALGREILDDHFFTRWHGRKGILHPSQRLPVPRSQGELSDVAASIFTTDVNVLQPPAAIKRGGIDTREA
jgi:hypothetical protein